MPASTNLLATITELCDGFNSQDTARVVAQFAPTGLFNDLAGTSHIGHAALVSVFDAMFTADPAARYLLDEQVVDAPNKALIVWRKTSSTHNGPTWWSGLDVLTFDDDGRIRSKSVYAKAVAPIIRTGGVDS
jgi:hypothetical protein